MPTCKNDPSKKYKGTEPSPKGLGWCAHGEKESKVRKGKDGKEWIVKKVKNGSKRWMKSINVNKKYSQNCNKFVIYEKKKKIGFSVLVGIKSSKDRYIHKWVNYNKFEDKLTKIPTGYLLRKITTKFINDSYCGKKTLLIKQNVPKIYLNNYKKYITHFNGDRPYLVCIGKKEILIYVIDFEKYIDDVVFNNSENIYWKYTKMVKKYENIEKVFIGKSKKHSKKFDGNTILLQLNNNKYVFICNNINEFKLNDHIEKYYSSIGNSDVPYPIILGKKNVYFMLDYTYVDRKLFPDNMTDTDWSDCYSYYYGHVGDTVFEKYAKPIKNIKLIHNRL